MATIDVYVGNGRYVTFDQEQLDDFTKIYREAKAKGQKTLTFGGEEIQMSYAIYVIEFVKSQLIR